VDAVGLTGQMHGLVALDGAGEVLRPAILWNDQRTEAECDLIRETLGKERLIAITGNDALPGFTAPKILWVQRHEPEVFARIAHVLLPKDFVRHRLSGDLAVDRADGAGTLLFELAKRDWSGEVLEALGIDPAWLPTTFEGRDHRHRVGGRPRPWVYGRGRRSSPAAGTRPTRPSAWARSSRGSCRCPS
jgi:xylulokinase